MQASIKMQEEAKGLPRYVNMDEAFEKLAESESPFLKGIEWGITSNPDLGLGLNNPTESGQNVEVLNPSKSNLPFPGPVVPPGININIGAYESYTTQELYYFNHNSNGNHGIYVLNGNEFSWKKIIEDPELEFTDNPEYFIAEHRVSLRIVYNKEKVIVEKILTATDGNSWQKWILTMASIATDGFNANIYPYWTLKQPHFDRKELLQWPQRPIMINPVATAIKNTSEDLGKPNRIIDQAWQFCCRPGNTDGRLGVPSSYSDPVIIKSEDFLANPNFLPKNILVKFYAGSPMTEFMDIFVRKSFKKVSTVPNTKTWGDWLWVERIYKFGNDPTVLSTPYWLRVNPWVNLNYDIVFNTIDYIFDNSKLADIIDQGEFERLQNDIPQLSVAQTVLDDKLALGNNRVNYNNAPAELTNKLGVEIKQKPLSSCATDVRKIRLYVYAGRDKGYGSTGHDDVELGHVDNIFLSQFGYYLGDDKQMRFGGIWYNQTVEFDVEESKLFQLDFADRESFRCYLKGTPFYADAKWYSVQNDADFTLTPVDGLIDATSTSVKSFIGGVTFQLGFFVGVFDFLVPAGRYVATLGRHNVQSSGDWRGTSTYIQGIADSRQAQIIHFAHEPFNPIDAKVVKPSAIVTPSKEIEVDCTVADVDVWGNGADLFYINCPFIGNGKRVNNIGRSFKWQWMEGYLYESRNNQIPVEQYPYITVLQIGQGGFITDKNGFFFGYSWGVDPHNYNADMRFTPKFNCQDNFEFLFINPQKGVSGWKTNNSVYVSDYNGGSFGAANRILYFGRVTNLDGSIGYSNIGVTIKDGETVYTDNDGRFALVIHCGQPNGIRVSNVYVNAGGNFRINTINCGLIPLFSFDESLVACSLAPTGNNPCTGEPLQERVYPTCLTLQVNIEGGSDLTIKENATYSIGYACADLAGRLMAVNVVKEVTASSYLQIGEVVVMYFQFLINEALKINLFNPDMKWLSFYVADKINILKYIQWVGDKIEYLNSNGDVVNDGTTAILARISIQSLYNYNFANNFSLLANWQFTPEDRLRILDNGGGQLFDVATYGEPIDLLIAGTNYNQAAANSGILTDGGIAATQNIELTNTPDGTLISFYVRYDPRLDKLLKKTGFWIELYTPFQQTEKVPYSELKWFPVVNGEISEFVGFNGNIPLYNNPVTIDSTYWDTYLFNRTIAIPSVGNKFFNHGFLSPNVSDAFGSNLTSGGRHHFRDDNARQIWKIGYVIKSDSYILNGFINGLGAFRNNSQNSVNYDNTDFGQILAIISQRNVILFICQNDFFTTNYDFHFAFPNEQGVMVVNQDSGLSRPFQKIGDNFGLSPDETSTVLIIDKFVFWKDSRNEAFIQCDYKSARDVSDLEDKEGRKYGINSYIAEKTDFISNWNATHDIANRIDTITGVDIRTNRVYLTFRPRRNNSNAAKSYINDRRNIDLRNQETVCFDIDVQRWVPSANFTPEAYGKLRGSKSGVEMITFAAGLPYYHLNTPNNSFLNYYGIQTAPVIIQVLNTSPEIVKIFMGISQDILPNSLRMDLVYDNEENSYSYVPSNMIEKKENVFYGAFLKDMSSYNSPVSTLLDGKRQFGRYLIVRFTGQVEKLNEYFQLSNLFSLFSDSSNNKK